MRQTPFGKKTDTTRMIQRTAELMGVPQSEIRTAFTDYWTHIDQMMRYQCGYGYYMQEFGHFLLYIPAYRKQLKKYLERIRKKQMHLSNTLGYTGGKRSPRVEDAAFYIWDMATRYLFLTHSCKQYYEDVLKQYPSKYPISIEDIDADIGRLVELVNLPAAQIPLQINNPVQKIYLRRLRKAGFLQHNPVMDYTKVQRVRVHNKS